MSEHNSKLNCAVGDLAITVNCKIPENLGNIVRVISSGGFQEWQGYSEPLYTWNVEVATEGGALFYECENGIEAFTSGPAPDIYLRRLTPPQGYLMEEFADSEQLQMNFHEVDIVESETNV
ncbi:hypothetical protein ICN17_06980 [Polynucleobacter sp. 73C-SIWE]|uniref:hypothetical protein n=1 Tax=Polynucleobacter sp. 73C-SIWE TaxID=2689098 RepID=UPI001C0DECA3|nr:hypothetical protein [Polynucleobacter sp. 73C-SIWE]MBU3579748.1 hypothetical protein [Polynucleobacter sp. 73C-SIWE]